MIEALLPEELESLLRGMENELTPQAQSGGLIACEQCSSRENDLLNDFQRPHGVPAEQLRALQTLHEGFSRKFGAAASGLLRTPVELRLAGVIQLTYREFVVGLTTPTCFNVLKAEPLEGPLILDMGSSLLFPIIDRLLGGGRETALLDRPLTEIELQLVRRFTDLFLKEVCSAWENVLPLELSVERVESNPQSMQIMPSNAAVVLLRFELGLGEIRGIINLCIPVVASKRIASQLSAMRGIANSGRSTGIVQSLNEQPCGAIVEVVAELATANLSTADFIALRVGDVIATEQEARQPLTVSIDGRPKFHATPGIYKGHKAVQVVAPIEDGNSSTLRH